MAGVTLGTGVGRGGLPGARSSAPGNCGQDGYRQVDMLERLTGTDVPEVTSRIAPLEGLTGA